MFLVAKTLRKYILALVAMAVFFWTVVLPSHFPHNIIVTHNCSCQHLLQTNECSNTNIISRNFLDENDTASRCPLCVLGAMFSLALIIEDNLSIITYLNEGELSTEFTSYSFKSFASLRARAPPKAVIS